MNWFFKSDADRERETVELMNVIEAQKELLNKNSVEIDKLVSFNNQLIKENEEMKEIYSQLRDILS